MLCDFRRITHKGACKRLTRFTQWRPQTQSKMGGAIMGTGKHALKVLAQGMARAAVIRCL
jgi:hypothetical protein